MNPSAANKTSNQFLLDRLNERAKENALRELSSPQSLLVDFSSNDYLGLARCKELWEKIGNFKYADSRRLNGSTGSRLVSGNSNLAQQAEKVIANYYHSSSALIFNSGYAANLGLFSCVPQRSDTVLYDELCHASIIDGLRLSYAKTYKFKHNNLADAEELLKRAEGNVYIAVESVYSMDGDFSPLTDLMSLCEKYGANLIVDEAHAVGLFGPNGEGRVVELNIQDRVFARVITFGKAMGVHGAAVLGSERLSTYLVNYARSFIYSTAPPAHTYASIITSHEYLKDNLSVIEKNKQLRFLLQQSLSQLPNVYIINSQSAIQSVIIPGNENVKSVAKKITEAGYGVKPVLSPTVAKGLERIRLCVHNYNTVEEIEGICSEIKKAIA